MEIIEVVVLKLPHRNFQMISQRILPHVLTPTLHDLFQGMEEEKTLPNSFYKASIIPISKPEKDITRSWTLQTNICHEHPQKY